MSDDTPPKDDELQIDEHATSMFEGMGLTQPFPRELVDRYRRIKFAKDKVHPGTMSPEMVAMLLCETKFD